MLGAYHLLARIFCTVVKHMIYVLVVLSLLVIPLMLSNKSLRHPLWMLACDFAAQLFEGMRDFSVALFESMRDFPAQLFEGMRDFSVALFKAVRDFPVVFLQTAQEAGLLSLEELGVVLAAPASFLQVVSQYFRRRHGTHDRPAKVRVRTRSTPIMSPENQHPPRFAECLLYFVPKKEREPLLGDLEEEYRLVYTRHGKWHAIYWYYGQVVLSLRPLIIRKLVKWGAIRWLGDVVRRIIS